MKQSTIKKQEIGVLSCGHSPSASNGICIIQGNEICSECAYKMQLETLKQSNLLVAYYSESKGITTWDGRVLAQVTIARKTYRFGHPTLYYRAKDNQGRQWWGLAKEDGAYTVLHAIK